MYSSKEIIIGIKVNNRNIWHYLYKYFYPKAKNHVTYNSGTIDDVKDVLQETFYKLFEKCRDNFQHDNVLALIMTMIKNTWIDMLRKKKHRVEAKIHDKDIKFDESFNEPISTSSTKLNLSKIFKISKSLGKQLNEHCKIENSLDYNQLNEIQRIMIGILLDPDKTKPKCRKLILLTHFLPISDNVVIANELGYVKSSDSVSIKKGLDILSTQKTRCLKKFKESLGISKVK